MPTQQPQVAGPARVVNMYAEGWDVLITRRGEWGNPYRIGAEITRAESIRLYRSWILQQPRLLARLPELQGKRLACVCKPKPCHGDVLAELVNYLAGPKLDQIPIAITEDDITYRCLRCGCEHNFTRGCINCDADEYILDPKDLIIPEEWDE